MARISKADISEMRGMAEALDGLEVHRDDWKIAEAVVAQGGAALSAARGPDKAWKRLTIDSPAS